jgi:hypothetical protein
MPLWQAPTSTRQKTDKKNWPAAIEERAVGGGKAV